MSQNLSVAQQILARAAAAPSAPAVYHGGHVYTYADLVRAAVVLEQALPGAAADGGVPQIVALVLPRSFDLVSSLLGVWLSGRAAIVVDVLGLPEERVEFILKDCNVQHVVTNDALGSSKVIPMLARVGMCPAVHYVKDGTGEGESASLTGDFIRNAQTRSAVSAATNPAASTLAYVVYTSGSTGRPKGVMVPHIGLMNLADYYRSERAMTAADCVAQTVSPGFDPIHEEMWPALTSGASLRIASEETRMAPQLLAEWLATSGVTICLLPTPVAELVLQCDDIWRAHNAQSSSFRLLICGGDVLKNRKPAHCWFGFDNHYGPSEATILATVYAIESSLEVPPPPPIGKPIPNTTLEIVDRDTLEPVPVGEWGEILLGGLGIALGYLNLPGKTNERFLTRGDERRRLYRTGDIGRIRASDGEVEFGGRVDLQVKIDGERIELGEVETCLANAPSVRECVVAARELGVLGKKQLVAYVVPDADARDGRGTGVCKEHASMTFIEILRKHAAAKLLPKMRPHHFVVLNELPLTSNGKVDRRGLPNPDVKSTVSQDPPSVSASAPVALPVMSAKEEVCATKICAIVASVLGASPDTVAPTLNVFELGASSLHCATMMLMVRKQMNFPGVGLDALFRSPTPLLLARSLLAATNKDAFTKCGDGGLVATARSNGSDTLMSVSDLIGEANTVLEEELGDIRLAAAPKSMALGPDIMLTGATGFLGAYLLRDLLLDQNFPNSNIYCTVRVPASVGNHDPTRQNAATLRVRNNLFKLGLCLAGSALDKTFDARVVCLPADLTEAHLGLGGGDATCRELQTKVGRVYHCASMVHYAHPYKRMKAANVIGTANIVRFCCAAESTHMIPLHHISTLGVYPTDQFNSGEIHEHTAIQTEGQAAIATGYSQSKFVGDALLRLFVERQPPDTTRVSIYRPARIVGDYNTGQGPEDFIFKVLRLCVSVGCYPDDISWDVDAAAVNAVSECIVRLSLYEDNRSEARITGRARIFHMHNAKTEPFKKVCVWLGKRLKCAAAADAKANNETTLNAVSFGTWVEKCETLLLQASTGDDDSVHAELIPLINCPSASAFQARVPFPLAPKAIRCTQTEAALRDISDSGTKCAGEADDGLRTKMAGFAVGIGWSSGEFFQLFERCIGALSSEFTSWEKKLVE